MITFLLTGLLASSVITSTQPVTMHAVPYQSFTPTLNLSEYSNYIVQEGDYMSLIAGNIYGNEDYWTNLWNDNPEVVDPAILEPGVVLRIRKHKTALPEELKPDLSVKIDSTDSNYAKYTYTAENGAEVTQVDTGAVVQAPPAVVVQPVASNNAPKVLTEEQINYLGSCEAGMDPSKNTGNGYYGAFQFSASTWNSMGTGYARADLAPLEVQKEAVQRLVARSSIHTQFPGCARRMRSIGMI